MSLRSVLAALVLVPALSGSAAAQFAPPPIINYSAQVYTAAATDPNISTPVAPPVTYALGAGGILCGLAKEPAPPTAPGNPRRLRFNDPADPTNLDCEANVANQIAALSEASGYRMAIRGNAATISSDWSAFSNSFNRVPVKPATPTGPRTLP